MPGQNPLCVDLDGTLLLGDAGIESALVLLRRNPLFAFAMLVWSLRGLAHLKREIARRAEPDFAAAPFDERILALVQDEAARRPCLLVTASDARLAAPLAARAGAFSEVLASDGRVNLAGRNKADALVARFGEGGFAYAGNSSSDLAVWARSGEVIIANAPRRLERLAQRRFPEARVLPRRGGGYRDWLGALRLHHWAKNLLVFTPLVGAHALAVPGKLGAGLLAWLLFGLCTSGTYLLNDLLDLDADRRHPRKRQRALASGRLDLVAALRLAPALIVGAFLVAALVLPTAFSFWLGAYLALTLAYSFALKRLVLVDAVVLAALFCFRILAGAASTEVPASAWLLVLALLVFFSLALLKRDVELLALAPTANLRGRGYRAAHHRLVRLLGISAAAAAIALLGAYPASEVAGSLYGQPALLWLLCPLLAWWLIRLWQLAGAGRMHEDPLVFALRDGRSWAILALCALVLLGAS